MTPIEALLRRERLGELAQALWALGRSDPRDLTVVLRRFGVFGQPETRAQTAKRLGISAVRVSQLEHRALAFLRSHMSGAGPRGAPSVTLQGRRCARVLRFGHWVTQL